MAKVYEIHKATKPEQGCMMVTGWGRQEFYNKELRKWEVGHFPIYCSKIRSHLDSALCPHHELIVSEEPAMIARKMAKVRAAKDYKRERRESLKDSPLAAFAPEVGAKDETYSR